MAEVVSVNTQCETVFPRIAGSTSVLAVWGSPVAHSRSPEMQNAAIKAIGRDWVYVPFRVEPEDLAGAVSGLRSLNLLGVNVTVPHKEKIVPLLDWVSPSAAAIGAVNTVWNDSGILRGYSTDGPGFLESIRVWGVDVKGISVCLIGAGGSARSVAFALAGAGAYIHIVNRTAAKAQGLVNDVSVLYPESCSVWNNKVRKRVDMVVNATTQGMHPNVDTLPAVPYELLKTCPHVYDLVYNPSETKLLRIAREAGCPVKNGLDMLAFQGAHSLSIWTGIALELLPVELMLDAIGVVSDADTKFAAKNQ